uniref:glutathione transferase n=1 Tax=Triticum urartu TaxID=4572 RepID=A0A8R7P4A3_TRIUA
MAAEGGLKLLGLTVSPFVIRVRMALQMKGVGYEYVEQDLFTKGELLRKSNPVHMKVPVLIHDGRPVCESLAIVQYVDEAWAAAGPSILPADPYDRAAARFWAAYADSKVLARVLLPQLFLPWCFELEPGFMAVVVLQLLPAWVGIMWAATEEERAEKVGDTLAAIGQLEEAFGTCSNGEAFFAGDSVGYLDLVVGSQLLWFEVLRKMFGVVVVEVGRAPLLAAWVERFGETDTAKEVVPDVDTAVEYLKKLQSRRAGSTVA